MEKATRAAGAALRAYVLEDLDSKTKKSINRVNKGEAKSIGSGSRDLVGGKMRCGRNQMRDQHMVEMTNAIYARVAGQLDGVWAPRRQGSLTGIDIIKVLS